MLDLEGRPAPHELRRRRDDDDEDTAHDRRRLALRQLFRWRNVALTTAVGLVAGLCVGALSPGDAAVERPLSSLVAAAPSRGRAELVAVGDLWSTAQHPSIDPPTALGDSAGGAAQSYLYAASYDLDDEGRAFVPCGPPSCAPTVARARRRPASSAAPTSASSRRRPCSCCPRPRPGRAGRRPRRARRAAPASAKRRRGRRYRERAAARHGRTPGAVSRAAPPSAHAPARADAARRQRRAARARPLGGRREPMSAKAAAGGTPAPSRAPLMVATVESAIVLEHISAKRVGDVELEVLSNSIVAQLSTLNLYHNKATVSVENVGHNRVRVTFDVDVVLDNAVGFDGDDDKAATLLTTAGGGAAGDDDADDAVSDVLTHVEQTLAVAIETGQLAEAADGEQVRRRPLGAEGLAGRRRRQEHRGRDRAQASSRTPRRSSSATTCRRQRRTRSCCRQLADVAGVLPGEFKVNGVGTRRCGHEFYRGSTSSSRTARPTSR